MSSRCCVRPGSAGTVAAGHGAWLRAVACAGLLALGVAAAGLATWAAQGAGQAHAEQAPSGQLGAEPVLDPRAAKARVALQTHCARCHDAGSLARPGPAGMIGDILDLDRIAADRRLVTRGNADASLLYTLMLRREMPADAGGGADKAALASAAEIAAVREWIESLPQSPSRCAAAPAVEPGAGSGAGDGDVRYVSLEHLVADCPSGPRLAAYRQAVVRLLNGLSRATQPIRPEAVGEGGLLLAFRLADIGWTAALWDELAAAHAGGARPVVLLGDAAAARGAGPPVLPADWLAHVALQPGTYRRLIGQPPTLAALLGSLGVVPEAPAGPGHWIGLRSSAVTGANRLVERRAGAGGAVWLAYDFAGSDGRRDILAHPLGPATGSGEATGFQHDAVRVIHPLPNGFPAFALFAADGTALDVPPAASPPAGNSDGGPAPMALGCQGCHGLGPRPATDQLREVALAATSSLPRAVRDAVVARHPGAEANAGLFADAIARHRAAMLAAGLDPDQRIDRLDPVVALAVAYRRPVDLARAAAELRTEPAQLAARLERIDGAPRLAALRLARHELPRQEFVRLLAELDGAAPAAPAAAAVEPLPAASRGWDVALVADKPLYTVGELATFTVRSARDCNLTLISVNTAGKATVIFPNDFEQDNALTAGRELRVPGEAAAYQLRLTRPGVERLLAVCMARSRMAEAIQQDYERQRFTALGDWRNFLATMLEEEEQQPPPPDKNKARGAPRSKEGEPPRRAWREPQGRAAIAVRVLPAP